MNKEKESIEVSEGEDHIIKSLKEIKKGMKDIQSITLWMLAMLGLMFGMIIKIYISVG